MTRYPLLQQMMLTLLLLAAAALRAQQPAPPRPAAAPPPPPVAERIEALAGKGLDKLTQTEAATLRDLLADREQFYRDLARIAGEHQQTIAGEYSTAMADWYAGQKDMAAGMIRLHVRAYRLTLNRNVPNRHEQYNAVVREKGELGAAFKRLAAVPPVWPPNLDRRVMVQLGRLREQELSGKTGPTRR